MSKRNIFPVDKSLEQPERVMLVGVMLSADYSGANEVRERTFQTTLDEAAELVAAAGGELVLRETAKRDKAHTAYFVGTGKAEELAAAVKLHDIGLAVFNHELTPTQERNLEKILQCRVLDRVGLILAIFAKRAQSQEGKLQVELAQLNHLSGRLVRGYGHLQSQKGGIGLKGPGETQLETDRRLIGQKITALKKQLAQVKKQRATRRKSRMEGRLKNLCHRRLYQRGQIQPVQPSDQGGRVGERPAFCHAGYDGAAFVPVARGGRDSDGYGRFRPRFAAQAGVGVFGDAGGNGFGGCVAARR